METVQEKVIHLIQKIGVEEVKPEASLMDDLDWNLCKSIQCFLIWRSSFPFEFRRKY